MTRDSVLHAAAVLLAASGRDLFNLKPVDISTAVSAAMGLAEEVEQRVPGPHRTARVFPIYDQAG